MPTDSPSLLWLKRLAFASLALLFIAASIQKIWGVDTWWQMATGRWILENGFPTTDVFSYTAADHPWIEVRWIFCILLHLGWQLGGPTFLIICHALILLTIWLLVAWPGRKNLSSPLILAILALAISAGLSRWVLRPELFTYLFCALFVVLLDHIRRSGPNSHKLWWILPLLQIAWTNSHTLFIMGPILTALYFGGDLLQRIIDRSRGNKALCPLSPSLLYATLTTAAACWLNPWFTQGALFPITLYQEISAGHLFSQTIGEFTSPFSVTFDRWSMDFYFTLLLAIVALATFALRPRAVNIPRLLLVLAVCFLAEKAQRNTGLLAIIGAWAAIANISDWFAWRATSHFGDVLLSRQFRAAGLALVTLFSTSIAWYVATDRWAIAIAAPREFGFGVVWWNTPKNAIDFLKTVSIKGPFFNAMRDGGFIDWQLDGSKNPNFKVYFDPRLEVFADFAQEPLTLSLHNWDEIAAKHGWNAALIPMRDHEDIILLLTTRTDWKLVYADFRNVIFVKVIPQHQSLIAAAKPFDAWATIDPSLEEAPTWKRFYGGTARPWLSTGLSTAAMNLGRPDLARIWLAQGLAHFPQNTKLNIRLIPLLDEDGRTDDANRLLAGLDQESQLIALRDSISRLLAKGNRAAGLARMEQYFSINPADMDMILIFADTLMQGGDYPKARAVYQALLQQHPTANEFNKLAYISERTGDIPAAIAAYRASLELDPKQSAVLAQLGNLYAKSGDTQTARTVFLQALALKPDLKVARDGLLALDRVSPSPLPQPLAPPPK